MPKPKRRPQDFEPGSYADLVMQAWDRLPPEDRAPAEDRHEPTEHEKAMHRLFAKARL